MQSAGRFCQRVALSGGFNQVVPQVLCRNYPLTGLAETFKTFGLMGNRNMARPDGISRQTNGGGEQRRTWTIIIFGHAQILSFSVRSKWLDLTAQGSVYFTVERRSMPVKIRTQYYHIA